MSEPFISFAQSFRVFFTSILALSSSGNLILVYLVTKDKIVLTQLNKSLAFCCFSSFSLSILILVLLSYISMKEEVGEGNSSSSKNQREINLIKFDRCKYILITFGIGVLMLSILFWQIIDRSAVEHF